MRDWLESADELDELDGNDEWKADPHSDEYDCETVKARLASLEQALTSDDIDAIAYTLRTSFDRNPGNIMNPRLYTHARIGTKDIIDQYVTTATELVSRFLHLTDNASRGLQESLQILDQLECARRSFGRTALLLSGGATFGMHHIGVAKALWETRLLPQVISGSSAGGIVGAVLCASTDEEIPGLLASFGTGDFSVFECDDIILDPAERLRRLFYSGSLFDHAHLVKILKDMLGDATFKEAYNRTRRVLNICVSTSAGHHLPWLLNFATAPDVIIWSAVYVFFPLNSMTGPITDSCSAASCCAPWVFSASSVMVKDGITGKVSPWSESSHWWIDGSVHSDLPIPALSEMFNATHFIVSQVNPHVIPFIPQGDIFPGNDIPQMLHLETRHGGSLTQAVQLEVLRRMEILSHCKPFAAAMKRLSFVMNQHYYGDINILPEIKQDTVPHILDNPTIDFMVQACLSGERATWPRLGRIRNHCAVEYALETALRIMRAKITIAASCAAPTLSRIRPNTNEASQLRKIIAKLRMRSQEYGLPRPDIARTKTSRPAVCADGPRNEENHSFHIHFPYHPSGHVRFRPSLKHHLTSSVFNHRPHAPDEHLDEEGTEHMGPVALPTPLPSSPSTTRSHLDVSPATETRTARSSSSRRPSATEEYKLPSLAHDEADWPLPSLGEDPAAPALTLQALIMAARSGPPSPEQEYHRISRRTSDWGHCGA